VGVLAFLSIGYMIIEAGVSLLVGVIAGSVSLVGFGLDSVIELASDSTALYRLRADSDPARRARAERRSQRVIAVLFLLLALYLRSTPAGPSISGSARRRACSECSCRARRC
jgi:divalent metal cation (Fe/Co/Zn/Cd) transporter